MTFIITMLAVIDIIEIAAIVILFIVASRQESINRKFRAKTNRAIADIDLQLDHLQNAIYIARRQQNATRAPKRPLEAASTSSSTKP